MNIRSTIQTLAATLVAVTALGVAPIAAADDPDELMPTSYAEGYRNFTTNLGSFNAGGFEGTWNGESIEFWCIQLNQTFGFNNTYTDYVAAPEETPVLTALGQLFTLAHSSALTNADYSAAFQLAIWELVYDGGTHDLASGGFYVTGGSTTARAIAQGWLSSLGPDSPDTWNLTLLTSASHQDFVTFGNPFDFQTVPEPAPLALLATAMLAMIVVRRRREHRNGA